MRCVPSVEVPRVPSRTWCEGYDGATQPGRVTRSRYMPSVSLTWGSRRWPTSPAGSHGASDGRHRAPRSGDRASRCSATRGPLGVGEGAHGVHERAARPEQVDGRVDERPLHRRQALRGGRRRSATGRRGGDAACRVRSTGASIRTRSNEARPERRSRGVGGEDGQVGRVRADQADAGLADVGGDHRRAGGREHHRLAARRRAQVGDALARLRADRLRHPLAGEVLHVAVGSLGDRRRLVHPLEDARWRPRAEVAPESVDDPVGIAEPGRVVGPRRPSASATRRRTAFTRPRAAFGAISTVSPTAACGGICEEVELVGAEAERVADAEVELAGDEAVDEEVAGALHARGAVDELGGEVAVARLERRALRAAPGSRRLA